MPYINELKQCKVLEAKYIKKDGIKYFVDGRNVVLDYNKKELEIANWLVNTFGGKIYLLPRINIPENIRTADYLWNNEFWDLKEIKGNSNQVIYHSVCKNIEQSNNFIFDITLSKLELKDLLLQVKETCRRIPDIKIIIIKKENDYFLYTKEM